MFTIPAPNPIAFNIFNFPVYKYGIIMAFAIFVAMLLSNWIFNYLAEKSKNKFLNTSKNVIIDYAPLIIAFGIVGARLYFCLLNFHYYYSNPIDILDIRQGGLSIHGAILGGIISILYVSYKIKIPFLVLMDSLAGGVLLGQAIGRWGNYFNSEAFGYPVAGQGWGLYIPQEFRPFQYKGFSLFHPTFLYESFLDLLGFVIIFIISKKFAPQYSGIIFFSYFIIYSIIRLIIEQIRIDSALNIGSFPIAQIVSIIMLIVGLVGCGIVYKINKKAF